MPGFSDIFMLVFSLIFVIALAIYVTRWVSASRLRGFGKNIKIIESIGVGQHNAILLLKVGEKYILVGTSKEGTRFLCDVNEDDIELPEIKQNYEFKNVLNNLIRGNKNENSN